MNASFLLAELASVADPVKAVFMQKFFKTGTGEYAEGDRLLGISVPLIRNIVKNNAKTPIGELQKLVENEYHEARLCALLIALSQFKKGTEQKRSEIFDFFLKNTRHANNWDLVDVAYPQVIGGYLLDKDRSLLYELAESSLLWEQRIAIVSTIIFIRKNDFMDTFALSEKLFSHKHDLIHKATGWMLREIGRRNRELLSDFLEQNSMNMPRTALRYAIEHYPEEQRQYFLHKDKKK